MKQALSTGKVAKYCFVTGDTVQNWIRSGILPAQRTAGGQYRVRVEDLRRFMTERDMSVQDLDRDVEEVSRPYCWEFHQKRVRRHAGEANSCESCVVKRTMALKCFDLRQHVDHRGVYCKSDCSDCGYYQRYSLPED